MVPSGCSPVSTTFSFPDSAVMKAPVLRRLREVGIYIGWATRGSFGFNTHPFRVRKQPACPSQRRLTDPEVQHSCHRQVARAAVPERGTSGSSNALFRARHCKAPSDHKEQ